MNPRHAEILRLVNESKRVMVADLSVITSVSEVTIRQDLSALEEQGYIKRVHGGAILIENDDIDLRMEVNFEIKQKLASIAADLVEPNESVLIGGGSANALLARKLADRGDVIIITPSAYIAHLIRNSRVDIILLGGVYQHQGENLVGSLTKYCIEHIHFSTAFFGIDGYHQDTGFTNRDMMRADIAAAIVAKNKRNIVLTDFSKFGLIYPSTMCKERDVTTLITNYTTQSKDIEFLKSQGIEVLLG